jgi:hypothetical protein
MNAVPICDELIFVVTDVDQEEELLVVVGWQWFDVLLQVVQVFDCLVEHSSPWTLSCRRSLILHRNAIVDFSSIR